MSTTEATSLRCQLDYLIHRFRDDTLIDGAPAALIDEVRLSLEEEFVLLITQYSKEDLQTAVLLTYDESRRLPLHLACDKNAPISILKALLDADVNKVSIREKDRWGDLPLHTACSRKQTEVVELLVDRDSSKQTLYTKADNGSLPIHTAARYSAPASVIALLLDSAQSRRTLLEPDVFGQLPLHAACRNGASPDVIGLLLNFDGEKETVMIEDNVGRLPVHLALLHTTKDQIEVVELILQHMICTRMERKGLDLWKTEMKNMLTSMETYERDFTTRDKLDIICDAMRNFKERVFTLELAVWRASCLQFDPRFRSMEDVFEHESSQVFGVFDAHAYKVDCRIKSGADIIVRDVISFVENEPMEEIMDQFKN
ncbi:hypothetical protein ACHAXM_002933 [Skeletonema potamos]|jgi:ankyrin repeat protein